jgi:LuxR family maltose regulon positive regulatory protein
LQLAGENPGAVPDLHRRAAGWLRSKGLPVEAAEHAIAAGDHDLVADILVEHHLMLIRSGGARTLLRWVQGLPAEVVIAHPTLAVGAATAATMLGQAVDRRRLLQLVSRAQTEHPERFTPYVQAVAGMVRAAAVETNVGEAVLEGRRAVAIAEVEADAALVAALGGYARALYLAGEADAAWAAALRAVEHPDAARRAPGHAFARSTLALVAAERGRLDTARIHATEARSLVGAVGSSRSWLGANASAAVGLVHAGEGNLAEAERELASAEHFFRDEVATVHHAWLLLLLARVRCRRGRIGDAEATLQSAREAIRELADGGRIPRLAGDVSREVAQARRRAAGGELLEPPSKAEMAVLRLLDSELSVRQIAQELFLSANTVRTHTRSIYRKLGVSSRADAVARADALGLVERSDSPM